MDKIKILTLFLLFALLPFGAWAEQAAEEKDEGTFFIEVVSDKEKVIQGDSCLISFVLYASHPFQLTGVPAKMKVKNGSVRRLDIGRQGLQRVMKDGKVFFAMVGEQYVLRTSDTGKAVIPESAFAVELQIQDQPVDPFDAFFGNLPPARRVEKKAKNEKFLLEVIEKPRRTMMQMKNSGTQMF